MASTRRTQEKDLFSADNIRNCENYVFSMQKRLDKAVANKDYKLLRQTFDTLLRRSFAVRILAVHRITKRNRGKYTAGIDGINIPKSAYKEEQDIMRFQLVKDINIKSIPKAIRRVYIPKPNGKKRPLGIPTIQDRIIQEILRITLDPIVEYYSHNNSFGFRPKRSCHDAVSMLFKFLAQSNRKRYIVEGDIKGCFDNINHSHISNQLRNWVIPKYCIEIIDKILKADIFHNGEIFNSNSGTPQGGVISPLLANVALTSFDNYIATKHGKVSYHNGKHFISPMIRYADDFVILCKSKKEAKEIKEETAKYLKGIGLTLSEEKTKITHIKDGFDFLGFNFRKYPKINKRKSKTAWSDYKLLIKPQKEKVAELKDKVKIIFNKMKMASQSELISVLNPVLQGWAMYYRFVVSKVIYNDIDYYLWNKTLKWGKRRHNTKSSHWIVDKYYHKEKKTFSENDKTLKRISDIPIQRFVKIKSNMRVYCNEHSEYWKEREFTNAYNQIYTIKAKRLFDKQKGKCSFCYYPITQQEIMNGQLDFHHIKSKAFGGDDSYSNLRLLHKECHRLFHNHAMLYQGDWVIPAWKYEHEIIQPQFCLKGRT